jgi:integrase
VGITKLKDGRYCVTYTSPEGKRIYRYRHTQKDAEKAQADLISNDGVVPKPSIAKRITEDGNAPTLTAWAALWLDGNQNRLRNATWKTYQRQIARVTALIGSVPIDALTPSSLTATIAELRRMKTGDRQLQQIYTVLRTCLEAAVTLDVLTVNPMRKVDKPRWEGVTREYWDVAETKRFIDAALASDRRYAPLLALLTVTGIRVSEALGLKWEDVNLELKTLSVKRALVWFYREWKIDSPKTKAGTRTITIPAPGIAALRRYRELTGAITPEYVFRGETGQPPNNSNLRLVLLDLCKIAGVPSINIHGLRHVAATMALRATKDIHAVQRRLGHANVGVTMGIYAYALVEDEDVSNAVDRMLDAKPEPEPPKVSQETRRQVGRIHYSTGKGKKKCGTA